MFTLGGSGTISFKMGGNAAVVKVFLEAGQQIAEYKNTEFNDVEFPHVEKGGRWATMTTFVADPHDYVGANLYIELHDVGNPSGWGVAFFDDIVTKYDTVPDVSAKSDDVTVYCEDAAGTKYQMPWVTAKNEITNPPANPTPVNPSDNNSTPSGDSSNDSSKPSGDSSNVDTGVESVAVVIRLAAAAGGAMIVARKRK